MRKLHGPRHTKIIGRSLAALATGTALVLSGAQSTASAASSGICSESLQVRDEVPVYHDGHYDSLMFVDAYNTGNPEIYTDAHVHVFHNRTHTDLAVEQTCSSVYINHPAVP